MIITHEKKQLQRIPILSHCVKFPRNQLHLIANKACKFSWPRLLQSYMQVPLSFALYFHILLLYLILCLLLDRVVADDVSLLVVLLDTNPFFWSSFSFPFSKFLSHVLSLSLSRFQTLTVRLIEINEAFQNFLLHFLASQTEVNCGFDSQFLSFYYRYLRF